VPDPEWGQEVTAFVVPADRARVPVLSELRELAKGRLEAYKAPRRLVVVEDLPRTASGKPLRAALVGLAARPQPEGATGDVHERLGRQRGQGHRPKH
jgi:O-succinylbenzoic acid--CoA ligase